LPLSVSSERENAEDNGEAPEQTGHEQEDEEEEEELDDYVVPSFRVQVEYLREPNYLRG
jgi:hypothetical protein